MPRRLTSLFETLEEERARRARLAERNANRALQQRALAARRAEMPTQTGIASRLESPDREVREAATLEYNQMAQSLSQQLRTVLPNIPQTSLAVRRILSPGMRSESHASRTNEVAVTFDIRVNGSRLKFTQKVGWEYLRAVGTLFIAQQMAESFRAAFCNRFFSPTVWVAPTVPTAPERT